MSNKAIVLDANILIRAVLGTKVRELILNNAATVKFFAPGRPCWKSAVSQAQRY